MPELVLLVVIVLVLLALRLLLLRPVVMEYQAGLLYRNGRFRRRLSPGQHWLFRPTDTVTKVDLRPKLVSVTGQEVVTADGVSFKLSLACRFRVVRPEVAINQVEDYQQALYQVLQLSLREIVSASNGDDLLRARKEIGERLMAEAAKPAEEFGLEVQAVNLKDITFPGDLKKIYSQVVLAQKEGQAALERARGETAALRSLANAAQLVSANPALMQLRLLQQVAASSGNTIILGVPASSNPALMQLRLLQQVAASSGNTIILGVPASSNPIPITTRETRASEPPPLPTPPDKAD